MPEFKLEKHLNSKFLSLYLLQAKTRTGRFTFVSVLNLPTNSSISLLNFVMFIIQTLFYFNINDVPFPYFSILGIFFLHMFNCMNKYMGYIKLNILK